VAKAAQQQRMITLTQKRTAQAIVNIFETSAVTGNYGLVTLIAGDTGHLTFGRSQTTLGSGNLGKLLTLYCTNPGARFASELTPFLPRFVTRDFTLDTETHLHNLLRASADDHVMREMQDEFFDQAYWRVAEAAADKSGIITPLGVAVVYDSTVHGSGEMIRDRTTRASDDIGDIGEREWIGAYVTTRRKWLATSKRDDLRATVYRMDAFQRLIELEQWGLELPLVVRGQEISMLTLNGLPAGCYDGPQPGARPLAVQTPLARGLDVRLVQLGLSAAGLDIRADGVFGRNSADHVRAYQTAHGLPSTGVADLALVAQLTAPYV
jgi:chitosanase